MNRPCRFEATFGVQSEEYWASQARKGMAMPENRRCEPPPAGSKQPLEFRTKNTGHHKQEKGSRCPLLFSGGGRGAGAEPRLKTTGSERPSGASFLRMLAGPAAGNRRSLLFPVVGTPAKRRKASLSSLNVEYRSRRR